MLNEICNGFLKAKNLTEGEKKRKWAIGKNQTQQARYPKKQIKTENFNKQKYPCPF